MIRRPPRSTLFPYTTLFRSGSRMNENRSFLNVVNPATGERIGEVPVSTPEEVDAAVGAARRGLEEDRKSTRLNSSHANISYAVFCLKKKIDATGRLVTSRPT